MPIADPAAIVNWDRSREPVVEVRTTSSTGGQKGVKPERFSMVPMWSVAQIAKVFAWGAAKYDDPVVGPHNWRRGYEWFKSYEACMRHLTAWWEGVPGSDDKETGELDQESKMSHLLHAAWHVLVLIWYTRFRPEFDDRPNSRYFKTGYYTNA